MARCGPETTELVVSGGYIRNPERQDARTFQGLFIGIDRYASDPIGWLSCAERDATALHSLFADTFGDGGALLTSDQATRAAILGELETLKGCSEDDFVVITFSGHGSELHQLVTSSQGREASRSYIMNSRCHEASA